MTELIYGRGDAVTVEGHNGQWSGTVGSSFFVDSEKRVNHFVSGRGGEGAYVSVDDLTPATPQRDDPVQSPSHYDLPGGIQVIDLIRGESFLRGNALKYIFRAPHKGKELEDMKKSREYINWEIERLENEQSN